MNKDSDHDNTIPIIDLTSFGPGGSREEQRSTAALVRHAFEDVGFAYIKGHGCQKETYDKAFKVMQQFFDLPAEQKDVWNSRNSSLYRGYNSYETGAHNCTPRAGGRDAKESFVLGAEGTSSPMHGPNQWPGFGDFEAAMRRYWHELLTETAVRLMRAFALSLGLDEEDLDYFCNQCDDPVAQMVLLRYPPNPTREARGCGAHTDCGFLTILAQDDETGGLQVRNASGEWIDAPPIPGTFVVNIGDMASQWTGRLYKSTEHRVYNASPTQYRYSIPFFINCNFDAMVEPIPGIAYQGGDGEEGHESNAPKHIRAGDYIMKKLGLMHLLS